MARRIPSTLQTVILCEGYSSLREGLEIALSDRYQVVSCSNVSSLPTLLDHSVPQLLIADIDGQTGYYDVLVHIRSTHSSLRLLLIANEFSLEQQVEALRLTNVRFIEKPFPLPQFLEKVEELLGNSTSSIKRRILRIGI